MKRIKKQVDETKRNETKHETNGRNGTRNRRNDTKQNMKPKRIKNQV